MVRVRGPLARLHEKLMRTRGRVYLTLHLHFARDRRKRPAPASTDTSLRLSTETFSILNELPRTGAIGEFRTSAAKNLARARETVERLTWPSRWQVTTPAAVALVNDFTDLIDRLTL